MDYSYIRQLTGNTDRPTNLYTRKRLKKTKGKYLTLAGFGYCMHPLQIFNVILMYRPEAEDHGAFTMWITQGKIFAAADCGANG